MFALFNRWYSYLKNKQKSVFSEKKKNLIPVGRSFNFKNTFFLYYTYIYNAFSGTTLKGLLSNKVNMLWYIFFLGVVCTLVPYYAWSWSSDFWGIGGCFSAGFLTIVQACRHLTASCVVGWNKQTNSQALNTINTDVANSNNKANFNNNNDVFFTIPERMLHNAHQLCAGALPAFSVDKVKLVNTNTLVDRRPAPNQTKFSDFRNFFIFTKNQTSGLISAKRPYYSPNTRASITTALQQEWTKAASKEINRLVYASPVDFGTIKSFGDLARLGELLLTNKKNYNVLRTKQLERGVTYDKQAFVDSPLTSELPNFGLYNLNDTHLWYFVKDFWAFKESSNNWRLVCNKLPGLPDLLSSNAITTRSTAVNTQNSYFNTFLKFRFFLLRTASNDYSFFTKRGSDFGEMREAATQQWSYFSGTALEQSSRVGSPLSYTTSSRFDKFDTSQQPVKKKNTYLANNLYSQARTYYAHLIPAAHLQHELRLQYELAAAARHLTTLLQPEILLNSNTNKLSAALPQQFVEHVTSSLNWSSRELFGQTSGTKLRAENLKADNAVTLLWKKNYLSSLTERYPNALTADQSLGSAPTLDTKELKARRETLHAAWSEAERLLKKIIQNSAKAAPTTTRSSTNSYCVNEWAAYWKRGDLPEFGNKKPQIVNGRMFLAGVPVAATNGYGQDLVEDKAMIDAVRKGAWISGVCQAFGTIPDLNDLEMPTPDWTMTDPEQAYFLILNSAWAQVVRLQSVVESRYWRPWFALTSLDPFEVRKLDKDKDYCRLVQEREKVDTIAGFVFYKASRAWEEWYSEYLNSRKLETADDCLYAIQRMKACSEELQQEGRTLKEWQKEALVRHIKKIRRACSIESGVEEENRAEHCQHQKLWGANEILESILEGVLYGKEYSEHLDQSLKRESRVQEQHRDEVFARYAEHQKKKYSNECEPCLNAEIGGPIVPKKTTSGRCRKFPNHRFFAEMLIQSDQWALSEAKCGPGGCNIPGAGAAGRTICAATQEAERLLWGAARQVRLRAAKLEKENTDASALTTQSSTAQPSTAQPSTAQPSTAQPSTAQPSTAQPSTAQPSTAQPSTAQPSAGSFTKN